MTPENVLEVSGLTARLSGAAPAVTILDEVSFTLKRGEVLGLVGESGCGKSITCLSLTKLHPRAIDIIGGEVRLAGQDLLSLSERSLLPVRGRRIAMIFQDPFGYQNPIGRIGAGLVELIRRHRGFDARAARAEAVRLLERVGIPRPEERLNAYPHELSGGMNQRVMIARALACQPEILIADEPTTALDVTTQAQILDLLKEVQAETGMAIILVTHDLGVIAEIADRICVMYCGRTVETAPTDRLLNSPGHPYTQALLRSVPPLYPPAGYALAPIPGTVPLLSDLPLGCHFHPRCIHSEADCGQHRPIARVLGEDRQHSVLCFHPQQGVPS